MDDEEVKNDTEEGDNGNLEEPEERTIEERIRLAKKLGPTGESTLCTPCGHRYADDAGDGKPWVTVTRDGTEHNEFSCGYGCKGTFGGVAALSAHESVCKGSFSSHWACWWCGCREGATSAKGPGPDMADQLCFLCSQDYKRWGAITPIRRKKGGYKCPQCFRGCRTVAQYRCHRQLCDAVYAAKHAFHLRESRDDLVYFTRKLACAAPNGAAGRLAVTPPSATTMLDPRIPNWLIPDLISIADTFQRFGPDLALPHMSLREIVGIACLDSTDEHGSQHLHWLSDEIHLRLTMLVMELAHVTPLPNGPAYFRYHQKHFANIGPDGLDGAAAVMQRCLDALSWEGILWQYVKHNVCDEYGDERRSAVPMVGIVETVGLYGYDHLFVEQRIMLLKFLINEVLGSEYSRKVLLDNANALEEHDRKRREDQETKRQREKTFFAQNPGAKRKSQLDISKMSQLEKKRERSAKEAERRKAAKQTTVAATTAAAAAAAAATVKDDSQKPAALPVVKSDVNVAAQEAKTEAAVQTNTDQPEKEGESAVAKASPAAAVAVKAVDQTAAEPEIKKESPEQPQPAAASPKPQGEKPATPAPIAAAAAAAPVRPAPKKSPSPTFSMVSPSPRYHLPNNSTTEAVRACVTAIVQKVVKEEAEGKILAHEINEEESMPIRLEPLGEDREYNRYWWTASEPSKLWIETTIRPSKNWPAATRAFAEGAKATCERIESATEAVQEAVKAMPVVMLREVAAMCGVRLGHRDESGDEEDGFDDVYETVPRDELIDAIFAKDSDGVLVTCAMELCEANVARARMEQAPKLQLQELLDLADIKHKPGMTRRELARLPSPTDIQRMLWEVLADGYPSDEEDTKPITLTPPRLPYSPYGTGTNPAQYSYSAYTQNPRQKRRRSTPKPAGAGKTTPSGSPSASPSSSSLKRKTPSTSPPALPGSANAPPNMASPRSAAAGMAASGAMKPKPRVISVPPIRAAGDEDEKGKTTLRESGADETTDAGSAAKAVLEAALEAAAPGASFFETALASVRAANGGKDVAASPVKPASKEADNETEIPEPASKRAKSSPVPLTSPSKSPVKQQPVPASPKSPAKAAEDPAKQIVKLEPPPKPAPATAPPAAPAAAPATAAAVAAPMTARVRLPSPTKQSMVRRTDHASWTGEENAMLRCLVFEHGEGDWDRKYRQLGTGRTAAELAAHWEYMSGHNALRPEQVTRAPTNAEKEVRRLIAERRKRADDAEEQDAPYTPGVAESNEPPNPVPNTETTWGYYYTLEELYDLLQYLDPRGPREKCLLVRMRRILPQMVAAMSMGRQVERIDGVLGEIMGVETSDFEARPQDIALDVSAGLDTADGNGLQLVVQWKDWARGTITMDEAKDELLPVTQDTAAHAQVRCQGVDPRQAIETLPAGQELAKKIAPPGGSVLSCHPRDVSVARQDGVCPKTGKPIKAWRDLVVWGRDTADAASDVVFCHAAVRAVPWPAADQLRRHYAATGRSAQTERYCGRSKSGIASVRLQTCTKVLWRIQDAVEALFGKAPESRKKTATWRRGAELCVDLEELMQPSLEMADMMVFVGSQVRTQSISTHSLISGKICERLRVTAAASAQGRARAVGRARLSIEMKSLQSKMKILPLKNDDVWATRWLVGWRAYAMTTHSDAQRTLAIYSLRERALLLGLAPPAGASMRSLPPNKPTPRPRAEALVVSLTTELPGKEGSGKQQVRTVVQKQL